MATYKSIKGYKVQSLGSDPSPVTEGQIWYDTAANALKFSGLAGAWASGGNLPVARRNEGGIGSQTAALAVMGTPPGSYPQVTTNAETYDGTNWTAAPSTTTKRTNMGGTQIGTQTAGQVQGGYTPGPTGNTVTEQFNGTSWSEMNNLNSGRWSGTGGGIITAGFYAGGTPSGPANTGVTEIFDGTNWTEVGDMNTARRYLAGGGTTTAGLVFAGGPPPSAYAVTEAWNGTAWTEVGDLNTARMYGAGIVGSSAQTSALLCGGQTPAVVGLTEEYDGTSWSEQADLGTPRTQQAGNSAASTTAGLIAGGSPPYTNVCEEWTKAVGTQTVTVS